MIIVGEKINSSIKEARSFMEGGDKEALQNLAKAQAAAGADYIDINGGCFREKEPEMLVWLSKLVREAVDKPLCLDSPNPAAVALALKSSAGEKTLINSISAEKERWNGILPLVLDYRASVIALCMNDDGMPETAEERLRIADWMITELTGKGVPASDIFIDPMVRPLGTGTHYALAALETIRRVMREFPGVHTICGLSNISFGMPARYTVNQAFLVMGIQAGLDSAILNPLDKRLTSLLYAAEALQNKDPYCLNFISAFRAGKIEP
ncbi:MAG: dihydropteroate synthase [Bacillota bacterium]